MDWVVIEGDNSEKTESKNEDWYLTEGKEDIEMSNEMLLRIALKSLIMMKECRAKRDTISYIEKLIKEQKNK